MQVRPSLGFGISMLTLLALAACGGGYGGSYGGGGGGGGSGIVTSIVINPGTGSLNPGKTQQFMATSKDSGGNVVSGAPLNWKSSNTSVATVDSNGLVTAKADGSTNVTASISYTSSGGIYGGTGMATTYTSNVVMVTVTGMSMVMGTAAVGHALVGAVITLEDARGQTQTAMSDSTGHFLLSSAGLKAPYLLKAVDNQGRTLFGMRADDGVANITPVTDLMARAWFASHGGDPETAFADPVHHPAPDAASLAQLDGRFSRALQGDLAAQGLDPQQFSFSSTPFDADGTGADHILDNLGVTSSRGQMVLQDRMGGQEIDVSALMREGTDSKQSSI